ncbi:MAG: RIP metalloprotease RseP [Bacteroidota bacterium]|nr:RIP metalloprotease RseP [Bacteroidota bacterium]MEC7829271.1 RIP metalloprotease RseP [Bacteroidota bacterium]MEC9161130.1 RIP metalloprotease RseP [Bacteroidota bacterium]
MEVIFIKAFQLLLSLAILVVLHELGHFIPAKIFKTRVEKFYLFFDPWFSLFKKKIGETVYGIGWLPLGGYVKISGMIDESMDKEQMSKPPQPWEFRSKPTWQRFIIMIGGVTVNLILGFLIYSMVLFVWGKNVVTVENLNSGFTVSESMKKIGFEDGDRILKIDGNDLEDQIQINNILVSRSVDVVEVIRLNESREIINIPDNIGLEIISAGVAPFAPNVNSVIDSVLTDSPADFSDLKKGDIINKVNGTKILSFDEFEELKKINSDYIELEIIRNGSQFSTVVPFESMDKLIGIIIKPDLKITTKKYGFFESIGEGYDEAYWKLKDYIYQFGYVFSKEGVSQLGGFGTIGNIFPAKWDWKRFWEMTAFLSIILAFMNFLPIPALDGGHLVFLTYEMVTGKKPNQRFLEIAQMVGIILLLGLFFYANIMDIFRFL